MVATRRAISRVSIKIHPEKPGAVVCVGISVQKIAIAGVLILTPCQMLIDCNMMLRMRVTTTL